MSSTFQFLPTWNDLRGNLWNDLIMSAVPFLVWLFTRDKGFSARLQLVCFMTGEALLALAGVSAVSRFGPLAVAPSLVSLVLPLLLLYWLEKRDHVAAPRLGSSNLPSSNQGKQPPSEAPQYPSGITVSPVPWPPMPADGVLPAICTADALDELRAQLGVSAMAPAQNELTIQELPIGVFGYTRVNRFSLYEGTFVLTGAYREGASFPVIDNAIPLHCSSSSDGDIEIHKSSDGRVYVVAFVSDETFISLTKLGRVERVRTVLRLRSRPEANHLIAIPRERLCWWRNRMLEDGARIADAEIR